MGTCAGGNGHRSRDGLVARLRQEITDLQVSEEKFRSFFETAPVSIEVVDEMGIIIEVNPFHVNHIGRGRTRKEDYIGADILERPSIVGAGMSAKYRAVLNGAFLDEREVYFPMTTGGSDAYYNIRGVPLRREGRITGAVYIIEDVTDLRKTQDELKRYRDYLEETVEARMVDLRRAYDSLYRENLQRKRAEADKEMLIEELKGALDQVKTLKGMLPICSSCKKIRSDEGCWDDFELYIERHTDAELSHGICPECARKLYPQYYDDRPDQ